MLTSGCTSSACWRRFTFTSILIIFCVRLNLQPRVNQLRVSKAWYSLISLSVFVFKYFHSCKSNLSWHYSPVVSSWFQVHLRFVRHWSYMSFMALEPSKWTSSLMNLSMKQRSWYRRPLASQYQNLHCAFVEVMRAIALLRWLDLVCGNITTLPMTTNL